jgi:hypothetical protein
MLLGSWQFNNPILACERGRESDSSFCWGITTEFNNFIPNPWFELSNSESITHWRTCVEEP